MTSNRILWFRHGLRLHDNPALLEAIRNDRNGKKVRLLPVFIFDGESAGTKIVGYNRLKFLIDSLNDLNQTFKNFGGKLYVFHGNPTQIFQRLWDEYKIEKICYEYDCEPIWRNRDESIEILCNNLGIECIEEVSHTLWNPKLIIKTNGGIPPLTYQMFLHTVQIIGDPPRPAEYPNFQDVEFIHLPEILKIELLVYENIPIPEDFNVYPEYTYYARHNKWKGGETQALINLQKRLHVEEDAFKKGFYLPNQINPDVLGPPTSMSAHLRFGCLSVRKFYWDVHDLLQKVRTFCTTMPSGPHITGQLIWREYFYTMSVNNINYGRMEGNEICLSIPWARPCGDSLERWKLGKTGFPLIDAAMRQLLTEGWIHHTLRNATATFLTRGSLWYSWEWGLKHFLKYLLDADWSLCAGNWMWVSSSAFEELLDSSKCTCPIALGRRLDPKGEYITRYIPELVNLPQQYIHEPWLCPRDIQKNVGCIIGIDYPERMIDMDLAGKQNSLAMKRLRYKLIIDTLPETQLPPPHCRPSNDEEICQFFWLF